MRPTCVRKSPEDINISTYISIYAQQRIKLTLPTTRAGLGEGRMLHKFGASHRNHTAGSRTCFVEFPPDPEIEAAQVVIPEELITFHETVAKRKRHLRYRRRPPPCWKASPGRGVLHPSKRVLDLIKPERRTLQDKIYKNKDI